MNWLTLLLQCSLLLAICQGEEGLSKKGTRRGVRRLVRRPGGGRDRRRSFGWGHASTPPPWSPPSLAAQGGTGKIFQSVHIFKSTSHQIQTPQIRDSLTFSLMILAWVAFVIWIWFEMGSWWKQWQKKLRVEIRTIENLLSKDSNEVLQL